MLFCHVDTFARVTVSRVRAEGFISYAMKFANEYLSVDILATANIHAQPIARRVVNDARRVVNILLNVVALRLVEKSALIAESRASGFVMKAVKMAISVQSSVLRNVPDHDVTKDVKKNCHVNIAASDCVESHVLHCVKSVIKKN